MMADSSENEEINHKMREMKQEGRVETREFKNEISSTYSNGKSQRLHARHF